MNKLQLIKSEHFGEIEADIYSNGNDMCMTVNQLANCLGYADRSGVQKLVDRNPYLNEPEFSGWDNLSLPNGKNSFSFQETRVFTEDGIYEITMLSGQPKAKEFRAWIRKVLKSLRRGQTVNIDSMQAEKVAAQRERSKAMLLNAQTRLYNTIMKTIDNNNLSPIAAEVFGLSALEQISGKSIGYRPACDRTYTATELAQEFGVTAQKVGKLANANGLKTEEYGITVMDKSLYSAKEIPAFRYNEAGKERLKSLLKQS